MLGDILKRIRIEHKESQEELAKAINTTRQQIRRYEKDEQEMTVSKITRICKHYKISADELLGLNEDNTERL